LSEVLQNFAGNYKIYIITNRTFTFIFAANSRMYIVATEWSTATEINTSITRVVFLF